MLSIEEFDRNPAVLVLVVDRNLAVLVLVVDRNPWVVEVARHMVVVADRTGVTAGIAGTGVAGIVAVAARTEVVAARIGVVRSQIALVVLVAHHTAVVVLGTAAASHTTVAQLGHVVGHQPELAYWYSHHLYKGPRT